MHFTLFVSLFAFYSLLSTLCISLIAFHSLHFTFFNSLLPKMQPVKYCTLTIYHIHSQSSIMILVKHKKLYLPTFTSLYALHFILTDITTILHPKLQTMLPLYRHHHYITSPLTVYYVITIYKDITTIYIPITYI